MAEEGGPDPADDERLAELAGELAAGVEAALAPWALRCLRTRVETAGAGWDDVEAEARRVAGEASAVQVAELRRLLEADIDQQWTSPLAVVRGTVPALTAALRSIGVPVVRRDVGAEELFPRDVYDLVPASLGELDPHLQEVGIAWGAAKAFVHLARRRSGG